MKKCVLWLMAAGLAAAQPMIIRTTTLIDGKGHVLRNQEIVVENGRIARIAEAKEKPTIDLSGLTVMPGWIDTHTHPTWYFNKDGRLEQGPGGAAKPRRSRRRYTPKPTLRHADGRLHHRAERGRGAG